MFGLVPEEQVKWTKEPIAHKADQSLLRNKLIKLNLLNNKHIFFNTISTFIGILDLGDLQYFVHFHN